MVQTIKKQEEMLFVRGASASIRLPYSLYMRLTLTRRRLGGPDLAPSMIRLLAIEESTAPWDIVEGCAYNDW